MVGEVRRRLHKSAVDVGSGCNSFGTQAVRGAAAGPCLEVNVDVIWAGEVCLPAL